MRDWQIREKILHIMKREADASVRYLDDSQIASLMVHFDQGELSADERRLIADHILANYLYENESEIEEMIDWIHKA